MKKLIGIAAKARSGKDTVASYLWERHAFTRIAFADPVKMAAQAMFGLSAEATWSDDMKETVIPYWGMSPRQLFQLVGTECVKPFFGNDIWIKRFMLTYGVVAETDDVVIPDVRFELEAEFIRAKGGRIIHLIRGDAKPVNAHVSEAGVAFVEGDIVPYNNGTLEELYSMVDTLIEAL